MTEQATLPLSAAPTTADILTLGMREREQSALRRAVRSMLRARWPVLALFILLHKGRGGGMSDLFGGGMSTSMGGTSVAERNLDRLTIVIGVVWLASILGLLVLYRYFPEVGVLG